MASPIACPRSRSPFLNRDTELPTSSTVPAISDPSIVGYSKGRMAKSCSFQFKGLTDTAAFLTTISFSPGGVYGAALSSRGLDLAATSQAAVLDGILSLIEAFQISKDLNMWCYRPAESNGSRKSFGGKTWTL